MEIDYLFIKYVNSIRYIINDTPLSTDLKVDPALLQIGSSKTISGYRHQRRKSPQGVEPDLEQRINNMNKFSNNRQSPPNNKTRYYKYKYYQI